METLNSTLTPKYFIAYGHYGLRLRVYQCFCYSKMVADVGSLSKVYRHYGYKTTNLFGFYEF